MNNRTAPQLCNQVHPIGAPATTATGSHNHSRALNGASYSMMEFVQLLNEQHIELAPASQADINPRPVDPQRGFNLVAEPSPEPQTPPALSHPPVRDDESLPPSSPPRSSPAPAPHSPTPPPQPVAVPRPVFTLPPPAPRVQGHATPAGLAEPRLPALVPRPPVFSLPSPPRAQPEAGPSQEPTHAEPSQPSPPFRFGPVRPQMAMATRVERRRTARRSLRAGATKRTRLSRPLPRRSRGRSRRK